MDNKNQSKTKQTPKKKIINFLIIVSIPLISSVISEFVSNPHNKERANSSTASNHTIIIDDYY